MLAEYVQKNVLDTNFIFYIVKWYIKITKVFYFFFNCLLLCNYQVEIVTSYLAISYQFRKPSQNTSYFGKYDNEKNNLTYL